MSKNVNLDMKILIINQYALPRDSAGITRHGDLASVLVSLGNQVNIIASEYNYFFRSKQNNQPEEYKDSYGVEFTFLKTASYKDNGFRRILSMLDYFTRALLKGIFAKRKPDIVVASSPQILAGLAGYLVARYHRIPFAFEVRDVWPDVLVELGGMSASGFAYKVLSYLEKYLYRSADLIIGVLPFFERRLQELSITPKRYVHVPNGVFFSDSPGSSEDDGLEEWWKTIISNLPVEKDSKFLAYAGSFGGAHDLSNLVFAFSALQENHEDSYKRVFLLLFGDGRQKDELKSLISREGHVEKIILCDPLPKRKMQAALEKVNFLTLPLANISIFKYGLSANKMFDYLKAGKPILMISPISETAVSEAQAGITVPADSTVTIAEGIVKLMQTSEEELLKMGESGRKYVAKNHDLQALGEKLEQALVATVNDFKSDLR